MGRCVSVFSHVALDRVAFQMCLFVSPRAEYLQTVPKHPEKGPEIFTESGIKVSGTQNIERSVKGERRIFTPNHSQVRRAAHNVHAELCALYPSASTKAAWQPTPPSPQEYQSELLYHDDKSS